MSWRAIDELRPSFEATRDLLFPFELRRWLVLAVIAFFVSGASGANPDVSTTAWDAPRGEPTVADVPPVDDLPPVPEIDLAWVVLAVGLVAAIGLALLFVGAIMEFVFVRVVTDREIRLRGYVSANASNGLSLLLFRIAIAFGLVAVVAVPAIALFLLSPILLAVLAVVLVPVLFLAGIGVWLVLRFTADFVVPVMVLEDRGVLGAWRAFWPALVAGWKQYGVYALVRLLLGIAAGIVVGIGFVAVGLLLAVPFGVLAVIIYLLFYSVAGLFGPVLVTIAVLGVLYVVSVVVAGITFVQVPVQTYLRYYSLFVLGGITPAFDMVGGVRPVREGSQGTSGESGRPG